MRAIRNGGSGPCLHNGALPLGSQPWLVLGLGIALGNALIWWVSERMLGTYRTASNR